MRKVLLASTALFALGSVSAMAADISISGSSTELVLDMGDSATADDSGFASEHDIASRSLTQQIQASQCQ